ncbi:MAG: sugar phosphate isomerase/epimerase [Phycisphaerales bacterium]|nr:sugar phosphate isomerase/epimerase [Phycisphaerae bacterium]NNM25632.1 sugar phosphate isomerase/epimerase [Phycisphaerales bacterium]
MPDESNPHPSVDPLLPAGKRSIDDAGDGVTRRSFLLAGSGFVAAAALRPRTADAATSAPRPIKKAVKYGMVQAGTTVREKFLLLRQLGFDGVELDSPSNLDPTEVLEARDESGLAIHGVVDSVHWSKPLSDPDPAVRAAGRAGLETALTDASRYGASTVLLVPAVVRKDVSYRDAYTRSQAEIRRVLPQAESTGVQIAFENVWNQFLLSPLEAARYVDEFESSSVGWYFDVGNIVNYGWPEHWIDTLGPRIAKLDIKEFSRTRRDRDGLWEGFKVELLEGDCDWPAVMAALDRNGFRGWATAEIPGGDATRLEDIAARMDRIIVS